MIAPALSKLDTPVPRRRGGLALLLRLWDRLTIYLPLLVTGLLALLLMPHLRRFLRSLELPPAEAFSACSEMLELFVLLAGAVTLLR